MSMKQSPSISVGIGAPSLLTIFLVLSLVSFSLLSYMTARTDREMTGKLEEQTSDYYRISNTCEETLAALSAELSDIYVQNGSADYRERAMRFLAEEQGLSVRDDSIFYFSEPLSDSQEIQVAFALLTPESAEGAFLEVREWKLVQTGEWIPDNSLHLMED